MPDIVFENELIRQGILFENEFRPRITSTGIGGGHFMQVDQYISVIMDTLGWTQTRLGNVLGVGQGTVSKWLAGTHTPNKKQWDRVLALIMKDPRLADLRPSVGTGHSAPVMGKIGAGAVIDPDFDQASSEGLYEVNLPFPIADDVIALEVEGQSMAPKYEPGDIIVVRRDQEKGDKLVYWPTGSGSDGRWAAISEEAVSGVGGWPLSPRKPQCRPNT